MLRAILESARVSAVAVEAKARLLSLDDWIGGGQSNSVTFDGARLSTDKELGSVICRLSCYFNGSYVQCQVVADTTGDAFLGAVEKIEKTIGREWRDVALGARA